MGATDAILSVSPVVTVTGIGAPGEWTPGPWYTFIAVAPTDIQIAGIANVAASPYLIDLAVGAEGAEVVIASVRAKFPGNAGYAGNYTFWFPAPLEVASGARVSGRIYRVKVAGAATSSWQDGELQLQYFTGIDASLSTAQLAECVPYQEHGKELTTNATAWLNSDWCEVTPGLDREIGMYAITYNSENPTGTRHEEWDIATGADGEEVVATTLRCYRHSDNNGEHGHLPFPAIYPIAADTRVAVRVRSSEGVARLYREVCLDYYNWETPPPPEEPPETPLPEPTGTESHALIRRLIQTPHLTAEGAWMFFQRVQLAIETGSRK